MTIECSAPTAPASVGVNTPEKSPPESREPAHEIADESVQHRLFRACEVGSAAVCRDVDLVENVTLHPLDHLLLVAADLLRNAFSLLEEVAVGADDLPGTLDPVALAGDLETSGNHLALGFGHDSVDLKRRRARRAHDRTAAGVLGR